MQDYFKSLCFESFLMGQETFDLDKVCLLYFLVKHLGPCSPRQFSPFLPKGSCSLGQHNPLILARTWLRLIFCLLHIKYPFYLGHLT